MGIRTTGATSRMYVEIHRIQATIFSRSKANVQARHLPCVQQLMVDPQQQTRRLKKTCITGCD